MVEYFVQGGTFMWPILICLILGIAISIERFISLTKASVNTRKFLAEVTSALDKGGVSSALEICQETKGPVASIFDAGLRRSDRGLEAVEKAIGNAGSIEMAFLERGMIWLSTFITVAPMLGFTGTVAGMIGAFDDIKKANDISPSIVASGISIALLTTLFGLVVAIALQLFHNYFVSRIDSLVIDMEETSAELVDHLVAREEK
ncbi:MotA/TolQ/ExbB proton channel family protein [candidate division KSB1 bacterium]|nr:MotA/TolQ/ExbB proton channel family protein [candidate division KSB1 bacterium]